MNHWSYLDGRLVPKISKRHFFWDIQNSFHGVVDMDLEPHQKTFWINAPKNVVSRGVWSFGILGGTTAHCSWGSFFSTEITWKFSNQAYNYQNSAFFICLSFLQNLTEIHIQQIRFWVLTMICPSDILALELYICLSDVLFPIRCTYF